MKVICYHIFLFIYEWVIINRKELLQKVKDSYHNAGGKEKGDDYYLKNEDFKRTCK